MPTRVLRATLRSAAVRALHGLGPAALLALGAHAQAQLAAPNAVEISPRLTTSGQPSATALASLASQGYQAVIYLAPPTVGDAVRDEALIVGRQGLAFFNLPVRFDRPGEADFEAFSGVLSALAGRKVLVHCQVNMRASTFVFLHRVIALREDPRPAWDAVTRVWSPDGPWKALVKQQLARHRIDFDPF